MFSFHKPKIYRSLEGCCICRAKSSSSRFTDSKRYEGDFRDCFWISDRRSGEICNACVLLVKRWKKLPAGSNRNWHHVVDARAGPGTKSIMKMKTKSSKTVDTFKAMKKHKHKKKLRMNRPQSRSYADDVLGDDCHSDGSSHRSPSPTLSEASDEESRMCAALASPHPQGSSKRKRRPSKKVQVSSFLDLDYWKKTKVCCGIIFEGMNGEVLVDTSLLRPCLSCKPSSSLLAAASPDCLEVAQDQSHLDLQDFPTNFDEAALRDDDDEEDDEEDEDSSSTKSGYQDSFVDQRNILEMEI